MRDSKDTLELDIPSPNDIQLFEELEVENNFEYIILNEVLKNPNSYFEFKDLGLNIKDFSFKETIDLWAKVESISSEGITEHILLDQYSRDNREEAKELISKIGKIQYGKSDIDYAFKKLKDNSMRRELLMISNRVKKDAMSEDKDAKESYMDMVNRLLNTEQFDDETQEYDSKGALKALEARIKDGMNGIAIQGVKTGIETLDNNIGCFYYGLTNVIVARPGHCKTTLMCNTFLNNILDNKKPVYVSLEMTKEELMAKIMSIYSNIPVRKIENPNLMNNEEVELLLNKMKELHKNEFYIVDSNSLNVSKLYRILKKYTLKGSEICYVDYMQLLKTEDNQIPSETGQFRKVFKSLREAIRSVNRESKIALVLAVQSGRSVESRPLHKRIPTMGDIEWSSSIEQDAGLVIGIMNREKYEHDKCKYKDTLFVEVSKNRFGKTSKFTLSYFGDIQHITSYKGPYGNNCDE